MYGKIVYITFILADNHHKVPLYSHLVLYTACVCYIHALRSHVCSELHLTIISRFSMHMCVQLGLSPLHV